MRSLILGAMFAVVGCGSDAKPAPTCQQGLAHYYASGCVYLDGTTNPPTTISQSDMVTFCQTASTQAPASCRDELDDWLRCDGDTPATATKNEDCDCTAELTSLLRCS